MAEEKHRMLFQGQDPSQPVRRNLLHLAPSTAAAGATQRLRPPTYDDVVSRRSRLELHPLQARPKAGGDRRHPERKPSPARPEPPHAANGPALPDSAAPQQPRRELPTRAELVHVPPVRSFPALAPQPKLGAKACSVVCPACGQPGRTRRRCSPNTRTHCWSLWLCSIGWCCCACLYPYMMDSCRTTNHYCTACKAFLGAHYPGDCCH